MPNPDRASEDGQFGQAATTPRVLILYATTEGQTARIVEHITLALRQKGHAVTAHGTGQAGGMPDPQDYDAVIVGAPIHYGHHPAHLRDLLRRHRQVLDTRPSAFFSVSLSGGGPGARPAAARRYVDKFLRQVGWQPPQTATFGGALQFSKYGRLKRWMMVAIVGLAGGDTDTSRDYEYTDWAAVEGFSEAFAQRLDRPRPRPGGPVSAPPRP